MSKISNCCGALPIGETCEDLGFCSECKEHAVFEEEKEQASYSIIKEEYDLKGNRKKVLDQFSQLIKGDQ